MDNGTHNKGCLMNRRINYQEYSADLIKGLYELSMNAKKSLDAKLVDLVNIRASQLNGCGFCLDMHAKEAKIHGERELRLYHVAIWHESNLFTTKERAALELTEKITKLGSHGLSEEDFNRIKPEFSEKELADLVFVIGSINFWNRINITAPVAPGSLDQMYGLTRAGLN